MRILINIRYKYMYLILDLVWLTLRVCWVMELLSSLLKAFYLRKHEQTFIFLCGDFETVHTNVYISRAFPPLCRLLTHPLFDFGRCVCAFNHNWNNCLLPSCLVTSSDVSTRHSLHMLPSRPAGMTFISVQFLGDVELLLHRRVN